MNAVNFLSLGNVKSFLINSLRHPSLQTHQCTLIFTLFLQQCNWKKMHERNVRILHAPSLFGLFRCAQNIKQQKWQTRSNCRRALGSFFCVLCKQAEKRSDAGLCDDCLLTRRLWMVIRKAAALVGQKPMKLPCTDGRGEKLIKETRTWRSGTKEATVEKSLLVLVTFFFRSAKCNVMLDLFFFATSSI